MTLLSMMEKGSPIPPQVQCIMYSMVSLIQQSLRLILYPRPSLTIYNKTHTLLPMVNIQDQLLNCPEESRMEMFGLQWGLWDSVGFLLAWHRYLAITWENIAIIRPGASFGPHICVHVHISFCSWIAFLQYGNTDYCNIDLELK